MPEPNDPPNLPDQPALAVIIPVYDDWTSLISLLQALDKVLAKEEIRGRVYLINDGSRGTVPKGLRDQAYRSLELVRVVNLWRNMGHQRSIAVGMVHVWEEDESAMILVMDADGQDNPADVPGLIRLAREHADTFVFAERTVRSEGWIFRGCYRLFSILFQLLTGHQVQGGNFSVFPRTMLPRLLTVSELWNHYAAAVINAKFPIVTMASTRSKRLEGTSKMNYSGLVIHGLSAISVFSEIAGVRMILSCLCLIAVAASGILMTTGIRLFTTFAVPGWATYTTGLFAVILLQAVVILLVFSFITLNARNTTAFLPLREAGLYIRDVQDLHTQGVPASQSAMALES